MVLFAYPLSLASHVFEVLFREGRHLLPNLLVSFLVFVLLFVSSYFLLDLEGVYFPPLKTDKSLHELQQFGHQLHLQGLSFKWLLQKVHHLFGVAWEWFLGGRFRTLNLTFCGFVKQ